MAEAAYREEINEIGDLVLREAKRIILYGPTQQKLSIIKSFLGVMARQAAVGQDQQATEMRLKLELLMSDMRNVPQLGLPVVGDRDFIEAEIVED